MIIIELLVNGLLFACIVGGFAVMAALLIAEIVSVVQSCKEEKAEAAEFGDEPLGPEALKALEKFRNDLEPFTHFGFHSNQYVGTYEIGLANLRLARARDRENAKKVREAGQ